jgi:Domain of unknown function (DUF4157)
MHSYSDKNPAKENKAVANSIGQKGTASRMPPTMVPVFQRKPTNTNLPDNLRTGIENLSGMDMGGVNVHYNSARPAQLSALAYAQGNDIHLGPGQEKHLPHEAWHVVQQREGRVAPTMQLKGEYINDDSTLEKEADTMGARALSMGSGPLQRKAYSQAGKELSAKGENTGMTAPIQMVRYVSLKDEALTVNVDAGSQGAIASAEKVGKEYEESSLAYRTHHYMDATSGEVVRTGVPMATQTDTMKAFPQEAGIGTLIAYHAMDYMHAQGIRYFQPDIMKTKGGNIMQALITGTAVGASAMEALISRTDGVKAGESEGCSCWDVLKAAFCCGSKKGSEKQHLIDEEEGEAPQKGVKTYPAIDVDFSGTKATLLASVSRKFRKEE